MSNPKLAVILRITTNRNVFTRMSAILFTQLPVCFLHQQHPRAGCQAEASQE